MIDKKTELPFLCFPSPFPILLHEQPYSLTIAWTLTLHNDAQSSWLEHGRTEQGLREQRAGGGARLAGARAGGARPARAARVGEARPVRAARGKKASFLCRFVGGARLAWARAGGVSPTRARKTTSAGVNLVRFLQSIAGRISFPFSRSLPLPIDGRKGSDPWLHSVLAAFDGSKLQNV
jgi:hypothetical protein